MDTAAGGDYFPSFDRGNFHLPPAIRCPLLARPVARNKSGARAIAVRISTCPGTWVFWPSKDGRAGCSATKNLPR